LPNDIWGCGGRGRLPFIHKNFFCDLTDNDLPGTICFALIDCDLQQSIYEALQWVYPRLRPGAVVLIHDYELLPYFPGVKISCDAYLADKPERIKKVFSFGRFVKGEK
jgi:O-methyltransferase